KYYTLDGVSDGALVFTEVATVSANTPYLVAAFEGSTNVGNGAKTTVDFSTPVNECEIKDGYQLKGTLRGLSNSESHGYYILQSGNLWSSVPADTPSVYIPPFRAYIMASNATGARMLTAIKDSSTGISHIVTRDSDGAEHRFDLNGRRIERPTRKGIYIKNSKKIVVK
ncbi:MAG: hypothetical protein IJS95_03775, partial [Prevotella sp.]|nr:hypothetical protein [Prevotella sp.]